MVLSPKEKQNLILLLESKNIDSILVAIAMLEGFGGWTKDWLVRLIPYICYDEESILLLADKEELELFWQQQQAQNPELKNLWVSYMIFVHGDGYYHHQRPNEYTYTANIQQDKKENVWHKFTPYQELYKQLLGDSDSKMWQYLFFKTACNLQKSSYPVLKKRALWFINQLVAVYPNNALYLFLHGYLHGVVHQNGSLGILSFLKALKNLSSLEQLEQEFEEIIDTHFKTYYPEESRFATPVYEYLEFYPSKVLLLRYLTDLQLQNQDEKQAVQYAEQALSTTAHDNDVPFYFLGTYYYKTGDLQRTISVFDLGLKAGIKRKKGDYTPNKHNRQEAHLEEKTKIAIQLGDIYLHHYEDVDKAIFYYKKATKLFPKNPIAHQRRVLFAIYVYKDIFQASSLLNQMIKTIGNTAFTEKYKKLIEQKRGY